MLSRLSFRAKLLLVLFVPFLALVVIAGAGLRDRFGALRAQEQYGELAKPLRSLDSLSRALENESVVTAWWAGATGDQVTSAEAALDATKAMLEESRFRLAGAQKAARAGGHISRDDLGAAKVTVDKYQSEVIVGQAAVKEARILVRQA